MSRTSWSRTSLGFVVAPERVCVGGGADEREVRKRDELRICCHPGWWSRVVVGVNQPDGIENKELGMCCRPG